MVAFESANSPPVFKDMEHINKSMIDEEAKEEAECNLEAKSDAGLDPFGAPSISNLSNPRLTSYFTLTYHQDHPSTHHSSLHLHSPGEN